MREGGGTLFLVYHCFPDKTKIYQIQDKDGDDEPGARSAVLGSGKVHF